MAAEQTEARPRVFISYSRVDSEFAYRLRADLEASGFDTWIDTAKLADQGGQQWLRLIQDAIDSMPGDGSHTFAGRGAVRICAHGVPSRPDSEKTPGPDCTIAP